MRYARISLVTSFVLLLSALLVPSLRISSAQAVDHLVITEVMYDPPQPGTDSTYEWIEIFNPTSAPVDLGGWHLRDNDSEDTLQKSFSLGPGEYLVIAASAAGFGTNYPGFPGNLITLEGAIGSGLANTSDRVILSDAAGAAVDAMSYGEDNAGFAPPCPDVPQGESLARVPSDRDTDTAAEWVVQITPNPGAGGVAPTPTATRTPTGTATPSATATLTRTATPSVAPTSTATATASPTGSVTPAAWETSTPTLTATPSPLPTATSTPTETPTPVAGPRLLLSEVLYDAPQSGAETGYEWVEVFNPNSFPVSLAGWQIGDSGLLDAIPAFTLEPGGYLVIAATAAGFRESQPGFTGHMVSVEGTLGNGLSNDSDMVRLIALGGTVVDAMSYGGNIEAFNPTCPRVAPGQSLARVPSDRDTDTAADWQPQAAPNPGAAGVVPPPTATPTVTASAAPTRTRTPTVIAIPSPTATASGSTAQPGDVVINEIMPDPKAVLDSAGEWFEVYNASAQAIDLNGWTLADAGTEHHKITNGGPLWLPAGGYLVLGRNADPRINGGVTVAYPYASFSLGNTDDEIILRDGAGTEIDRVAYDGGPAFPDPAGASMQLIRPDLDNAVGANWRAAALPWPGGAGDLGSPGAVNHTARIEGYVYEDHNANRVRDAGEPGIADVVISLADGRAAHTFASGWYALYDLAPGAYVVSEQQPAGFASTTPDRLTVTVSLGQISVGHNFGEVRLPPTDTPTAGPSPTATPSAWPRLLLSEVLYDAPQEGTDSDFEWVEVFNPGEAVVSLAGWAVADNGGRDMLPAFDLRPGAYLVIAATADGFAANQPGFTGNLIALGGAIGNGLSNSGDVVQLLAPDGTPADRMSYGDNTAAFSPPCPDVPAGQSLARVPSDQDTDTAADWAPQRAPNPGGPGAAPPSPTPTPTGTPTATPTVTPTGPAMPTVTPTPTIIAPPIPTPTTGPWPAVWLNEVLPRPDAVDWDGNGKADAYDEWIELYNASPATVDLGGWVLDDLLGAGSQPYTFPSGTLLASGQFLVRYRSTTGVALNQDVDAVNLLAPDGAVIDSFAYHNPGRDNSYSRAVDGAGDWVDTYPPSPGSTNLPGLPTPTPSPGPTTTVTRTPTVTPTVTVVIYDPAAVSLNEVLPAPAEIDWNGDGKAGAEDEWVELFNRGTAPIDLAGWALDDLADGGSKPYVMPGGMNLAPGQFLVLFRSQTGLAFNNDADTVRLLGPDGVELDTFGYTHPRPDRSYSRSVDGAGAWTDAYPPSPGASNLPATPTPTPTATATATAFPAGVTLNEILPDPGFVDWDQNGSASFSDEWIELYNAGSASAMLGGWAVIDDTQAYTLPVGTVIWPHGFLLLFRRETGLSLGDSHDRVALLRPDGSTVDAFAYDLGPGNDRSFCRSVDGAGGWSRDCDATPGSANRLWPTPVPGAGDRGDAGAQPSSGLPAGSIAAARAAADDTRVTVTGAVTVPPGLLGRDIYLQDETGGIKVYLRAGEYPPLAVGDRVRVTGWLHSFHGETELSAPDPSYVTRLGPGAPPAAFPVSTGQLGEAHEGRLVWVMGRVTKFEPQALTLDDGTGPARIYFPDELSWRRPYVQIGELWAAQGVVSQYAPDAPYVGGYRLIPRFETDVSLPPAWLPVTGGCAFCSGDFRE